MRILLVFLAVMAAGLFGCDEESGRKGVGATVDAAQLATAMKRAEVLRLVEIPALRVEVAALDLDVGQAAVVETGQYRWDQFAEAFPADAEVEAGAAVSRLSSVCAWRGRLAGVTEDYLSLLDSRAAELSAQARETVLELQRLWALGGGAARDLCSTGIVGVVDVETALSVVSATQLFVELFRSGE